MDESGQRYTDDQYPTGEIPYGELIFPVTTAGDGTGEIQTIEEIESICPGPYSEFPVSTIDFEGTYQWYYRVVVSGGSVYACAFVYGNSISIVFSSKQPFRIGYDSYKNKDNPPVVTPDTDASKYTKDSKTVYRSYLGTSFVSGDLPYNNSSGDIMGRQDIIAWNMIYGDVDFNNDIPVQWMRSDGTTLEDTFEIQVTGDAQSESGTE
jgi:hypothetical protein